MAKIQYDPFNLEKEKGAQIKEKEFIRHTFIISKKHLEDIKTAAYWQRKTQKELLGEILGDYFSKHDPNAKPADDKRYEYKQK